MVELFDFIIQVFKDMVNNLVVFNVDFDVDFIFFVVVQVVYVVYWSRAVFQFEFLLDGFNMFWGNIFVEGDLIEFFNFVVGVGQFFCEVVIVG